ncbi:MAG: hypothetical protein H7Y18_08985 [Clostridiaceae bacterium]|nr:hypothetical protein [Clostridiaceae bacterium]
MGYSVIDLINKAINIEVKRKIIYEKIGREKFDIQSIKIMSKVLIKDIDRTIQYYETIKVQVGDIEFEEIDFWIYDKMSFLIDEFNKKICDVDINDVREFLKYSYGLEKDICSLIIDVQGRFVKNTSDTLTNTYRILSHMIDIRTKHIATLEVTLR